MQVSPFTARLRKMEAAGECEYANTHNDHIVYHTAL